MPPANLALAAQCKGVGKQPAVASPPQPPTPPTAPRQGPHVPSLPLALAAPLSGRLLGSLPPTLTWIPVSLCSTLLVSCVCVTRQTGK